MNLPRFVQYTHSANIIYAIHRTISLRYTAFSRCAVQVENIHLNMIPRGSIAEFTIFLQKMTRVTYMFVMVLVTFYIFYSYIHQ